MMKAIKRLLPEPVKDLYRTARYRSRIALRTWLRDDPSQAGEVTAVRRLIGPDWPRFLVDVGANDGRNISNTYPFVRDGWTALLLEPNPAAFERLKQTHAGRDNAICVPVAASDRVGTATMFTSDADTQLLGGTINTDEHEVMRQRRENTRTITVPLETLTNVLSAHEFPADFSLLSIDAEGCDLEVLKGLNFARYRPRVIITEEYRVHAEREAAKLVVLREAGYRMLTPIGCNELWLRTDLP